MSGATVPEHWPAFAGPKKKGHVSEEQPFEAYFYVNHRTGSIESVARFYPKKEVTWLTYPHANVCSMIPPRVVPEMIDSFRKSGLPVVSDSTVEQIVRQDLAIREDAILARQKPAMLDIQFPHGLKLFEYQRKCLDFCLARRGRFLLADEPGTGKTIMAIACAVYMAAFPVLVIAPANVKYVWPAEIKKWTGVDAQVVEGQNGFQNWTSPWVVVNWDILAGNYEMLQYVPWGFIIADEIHYAKGANSKRSQAFRAIARKTRRIVGLSGTPITNKPLDLWPILDAIEPDRWGTHDLFGVAYNGGTKKGKHYKFKRPTNVPHLFDALQGVMLRRRKEEVLPFLPSKIRASIPIQLPLPAWQQYQLARQATIAHIKKNEITGKEYTLLVPHLHAMRRAASHGRLWATVQKALEITEPNVITGQKEPVVIYAEYLDTIDFLKTELERWGRRVFVIKGGVHSTLRKQFQDEFQAGMWDVLIGQIVAAHTGLTLTKARFSLHHEITWVPTQSKQCEDRINRIGTTDKTTHFYFLSQGTIDERMIAVNAEKMAASDAILDKGEEITGSIIKDVLQAEFGLKVSGDIEMIE